MLSRQIAPPDVEEIRSWVRIVTARLDAIGRGMFGPPPRPPTPEQHEEFLKTIHPLQGPNAAQRREMEAFLVKADGEDRKEKLAALDHYVRRYARAGMSPREISKQLTERWAFPKKSASEKAVNARLQRARAAGFEQPISPTAKRPRTKSK